MGKVSKQAMVQLGDRLVSQGTGELVLRDLTGRSVLSRKVSGQSVLELSSLPRGIFAASFQGTQILVRHLD